MHGSRFPENNSQKNQGSFDLFTLKNNNKTKNQKVLNMQRVFEDLQS